MRCPTLAELPQTTTGKAGWPRTEESEQLPEMMPDGAPWPKISIVTPSYNQGQFIEETIRSVLLQGYPNLEYIIIDGGSTDNSVEIIKRYAPWLSYWVSEPDRGQAHAINKGFRRATGDIVAWLNSDDIYARGTLAKVATAARDYPDAGVIYGDTWFIDEAGEVIRKGLNPPTQELGKLWSGVIVQPEAFIRAGTLETVGLLNEEYHFCLDHEYWLRASQHVSFQHVPRVWAYLRSHSKAKGSRLQTVRWHETIRLLEEFYDGESVSNDLKALRQAAIGQAHWFASLAFWRNDHSEEVSKHISDGVRLAPEFLATETFIAQLVGTKNIHSLKRRLHAIRWYFDHIPDGTPTKRVGFRRARARAHAVAAATADNSSRVTRAKNVLWATVLNPMWLTNRNVARAGVESLLGTQITDLIRTKVLK